jgi:hypothetical protein
LPILLSEEEEFRNVEFIIHYLKLFDDSIIEFVKSTEWPPNYPDLSLSDYCFLMNFSSCVQKPVAEV